MGVFAVVEFPGCGPSSHYRSDVSAGECGTADIEVDARWTPWVRTPVLDVQIIAKAE